MKKLPGGVEAQVSISHPNWAIANRNLHPDRAVLGWRAIAGKNRCKKGSRLAP